MDLMSNEQLSFNFEPVPTEGPESGVRTEKADMKAAEREAMDGLTEEDWKTIKDGFSSRTWHVVEPFKQWGSELSIADMQKFGCRPLKYEDIASLNQRFKAKGLPYRFEFLTRGFSSHTYDDPYLKPSVRLRFGIPSGRNI